MAEPTVWEQIQEKRKKVEELKGLYKQTYAKAMADGELSDQEKNELAVIDGGVKKAQGIVRALEEEFEANKKKWEGRAGDYKTLQKQKNELEDWGDPTLPDIGAWDNEIGAEAMAMAWLNAIAKLDRAQNLIKPFYEEYKKQLPFRDKYNQTHDGVEELGKKCASSDFAKKDSIAKSLTAFENSMKSAAEAAEGRKYDDACRLLDDAKATAEDVDGEIKDLREKHDKCRAEFASVKGEAVLYATSKYKTVQALNERLEKLKTKIGTHMEAFEYDLALGILENARTQLAQMKAEHEKKEKEEADWKAKEPELAEAQKKAAEVKEFGGKDAPDVDVKVDDAGKQASDEKFEEAAKKADEAKAEADEAHKKMEEQKKKKEAAAKNLDDIQKKVDAILESMGV